MEMPGELELILERSAALGVRPLLGVRVKLITKAAGTGPVPAANAPPSA